MFNPLALLNFKLLLALFLALACLSSVCATPVPAPAPGIDLPLLSNNAESTATANSAGEKPPSALALLSSLDSLDSLSNLSSVPALSNVGSGGTGVAASAGTQEQPKLQMLSLRGRVVAYRAPTAAAVQRREHRARGEDADEDEDAVPLKRAERFQLRMMRRGPSLRA